MGYPSLMACPPSPAGSRRPVPRALVLVVEDEELTAEMIREALEAEGYAVEVAPSLFRARGRIERLSPQLVVLDRRLPDGDGADFCRELRAKEKFQNIPVLFLTSKKSVPDRVVGLKLGGDDYLQKPFAVEEFVARVEALLRRAGPQPGLGPVLRAGEVEIQLDSRKAYLRGKELELRRKEFDLLCAFVKARGRVLTREHLLAEVWGHERGLEILSKTVDVTVANLRQRLGSYGSQIVAVAGYGYRFEAE